MEQSAEFSGLKTKIHNICSLSAEDKFMALSQHLRIVVDSRGDRE